MPRLAPGALAILYPLSSPRLVMILPPGVEHFAPPSRFQALTCPRWAVSHTIVQQSHQRWAHQSQLTFLWRFFFKDNTFGTYPFLHAHTRAHTPVGCCPRHLSDGCCACSSTAGVLLFLPRTTTRHRCTPVSSLWVGEWVSYRFLDIVVTLL